MNRSTACLLLGFCHAGPAVALGLGGIDVQSPLGQPLHAVVPVLGASAELSVDCFRVDPAREAIDVLPRTSLALERDGQTTRLHVRTRQAVDAPILQFVLLAECEDRFQREYVILLDPPPLLPLVPASPGHPAPGTRNPSSAAHPAASAAASAAASVTGRAVLPAAQTPAAPSRPAVRKKKKTDQPRLILSGRHQRRAELPSPFLLQLDTRLPDLTRAPDPERLTPVELSDENTALTRKLAHLERQLLALQQRNAELEARRPAVLPAAPPADTPSRWPLALLVTGLLAGVLLLAVWMRRRPSASASALPDLLAWTQSDKASVASSMPACEVPPAAADHPARIADIPPPPAQAAGTEVKEDILDQAEVFMAHGHGDLAVHLLQEHLRQAPTESPVPWLLLLDLLHRSGDAGAYAVASTECRRYFNVNLSGHPVSQDGEPPGPGLEAYPHVLEQLVHVWNTPEINTFFDDLIYDKRGGTRMGFEPGAYRDLLLLRDIAREALPLAA